MKSDEVADYAVRDPFTEPQVVEIKPTADNSRLIKVLSKIVYEVNARNGTSFENPMMTPSRMPRAVIDATEAAVCDVCGQGVWVSPSSAHLVPVTVKVCMDCFLEASK